jgi:glycine cleavage system H protein
MARLTLRKKDLPEGLRYSRERLWVRELPGGVFRVGVCLPGIHEETPGVYFLDARRSGYIVTGKKVGFLDLDTGRFDLVAPLSGRIARVNPKVLADPGALALDCFGEGWLFELTRVLPQALDALLDRDSFYGWLRFELEARRLGLDPTVSCAQRVVAGEPWPEEITLRFGGRVVVRSRPVRLGRNETFTPQWSQGDTWRVKVEFEQPSIMMVRDAPNRRVTRRFEYLVEEEYAEAGGEDCWRVRVTEVEGPPAQKALLLYISRRDFALRQIDEVSAHDPRLRSRLPNDWGAEGYVELRKARELIVDLPLFPSENRDERRTVAVGEEPRFTAEARFEPKVMRLAIEADARGARIRSEQTWERGLPWWREARRLAGESVLMSAELVTPEAR